MIKRNVLLQLAAMLTIVAGILVVSCKKDNSAPNFHYDYFPTGQGRYVTYSVREVYIDNALNINDTSEYFVKAKIGDTITDNEGRVARRYERYVRETASDPWVLQDIWTTIVNGNKVELVEENQRVIKLVLAPDKFKEWDANVYNQLGEQECYYVNIHEPGGINGFSFDSTVTVEQEDYFTMIDYRRKYEQYAKGVGMYYKHWQDFKISNFNPNNVTKGREIIMQLIDYGIE